MTANETHWACYTCEAKGHYNHTAASGTSGPAHKHTETTGHATTSGTDSERVARMAGGAV